MYRFYLLLTIFLKGFDVNLHTEVIKIPEGKSVLIDGKITGTEWSDAKMIKAPDSVFLFLKTHEEYVLLAIAVPADKNAIEDLYFYIEGQLINFHASAKLGQRNFINSKWEDWIWWNNEKWAANISKVESFENHTFFKQNVREFQLHKSIFKGKQTRLFLETTFLKDSTSYISHFPNDAENNNMKNWLDVKWD
jgi:hypothetical protein